MEESRDRCKTISELVNFGAKPTLPKDENPSYSKTIWTIPPDLLKTILAFKSKQELQSRPASTAVFGSFLISDYGVELASEVAKKDSPSSDQSAMAPLEDIDTLDEQSESMKEE
ncbi:hypothetical protein GEMRC1_003874 [Eukaryota sp. GEM-RC1]